MCEFVDHHEVRVPDDKSGEALWGAPALTMHCVTLALLERHPKWRRVPLTLPELRAQTLATGLMGLPPWLRAQRAPAVDPPRLFIL